MNIVTVSIGQGVSQLKMFICIMNIALETPNNIMHPNKLVMYICYVKL